MENITDRIKSFSLKIKNKNSSTDKIRPIIFMNSPISTDKDDVIGFDSAVNSVAYAINHEAKMIGIIADYGTGKSSLTEILATDRKAFGKVIKINMWDSLTKNVISIDKYTKENINALTKSFLFQLASGVSENTAKHINKLLSKNYGIISFSLSSLFFWLYMIIAALFGLIYIILDKINISSLGEIIIHIFNRLPFEDLVFIINIAKYSAPVFLVISLGLLLFGLRNTNIAFSHWKSQKIRETEINDVFDAYTCIYKKILPRPRFMRILTRKNRIVIIEDLDRIIDKNIVIGFLKEIYRFNAISKYKKGGPAFIIAVKPESQLMYCNNCSDRIDDLDVYTKLFDFTVALKPIHYQDYKDILIALIGERIELLNNTLELKDQIIDNILPDSFNWLAKGHNLTIRQLKDRLNQSIALFISLKNKKYANAKNTFINFSSCAAVTYLELHHSHSYYDLIAQEEALAELIQQSYTIRNSEKDKVELLLDEMNKSFKDNTKNILSDEIKKDLATMIINGDIDNDFRMYFYSYPKGSYIMTSDEKDISNLLLLPRDFSYDDNLDEKIDRLNKNKKITTITNILKNISKSENNVIFPIIVCDNESLFNIAVNLNYPKMFLTVCNESSWSIDKIGSSKKVIEKIYGYNFIKKEKFINDYGYFLKRLFEDFDVKHIINIRKELIDVFKENIHELLMLFLHEVNTESKKIPIISNEEISSINNIDITIQLIEKEMITDDNFEYLGATLIKNKLSEKSYSQAYKIMQKVSTTVSLITKYDILLLFLEHNNKIDDAFFNLILIGINENLIKKSDLCKYINSLPTEKLTDVYLNGIDQLAIDQGLTIKVLMMLKEKKYFITFLASLSYSKSFELIDFENEEIIPYIISACETLNNYNPISIIKIRTAILEKDESLVFKNDNEKSNYNELFHKNYPLISKEETDIFTDFSKWLYCINGVKIDENNFKIFTNHINFAMRAPDECYQVFERLFNKAHFETVSDSVIVKKIVYELDYHILEFSQMSSQQKEEVVLFLQDHLSLNSANEAINFMFKVNTLIESCENTIIINGQIDEYVKLFNTIDNPTEYTLNWIVSTNVDFPLSENIQAQLFNLKHYEKYLIGKILNEKSFDFPISNIDSNTIAKLYYENSPIFTYLSSNIEFLSFMILSEKYTLFKEPISINLLMPLYKGKQTLKFVEFVFSKVEGNGIINYLENMGKTKDSEDSKDISNFFLKEKNIEFLNNDELFERVFSTLWKDKPKSMRGHKANFRRKRNEYFRNK